MTFYSKPELDAMSKSELEALARELGVQVCGDLNMLVYSILDAQTQAYIEEHKKQTRRKASTKTCTKAKTKAKTKSKMEESRANEDWAKTQLEKVQEETKPIDVKTRELLTGILAKWSCQWEVDENGTFVFHYQGGHFQVHFCDGAPFLYVYYTSIYSVEAYQKKKTERVKELINRMNLKSSLKMVYTVDPDDGEMLVHIEDFFPLLPEIPHVEDYLKFMLCRVFRLQHDFVFEMDSVE